MPKPIKKRRVDLMAVLRDHEIRITSLEQIVYSLINKLVAAARENTDEGGIRSESEGQVRTDETSIESCPTAADDLCVESHGVGSEEVRAV